MQGSAINIHIAIIGKWRQVLHVHRVRIQLIDGASIGKTAGSGAVVNAIAGIINIKNTAVGNAGAGALPVDVAIIPICCALVLQHATGANNATTTRAA